MINEQKTITRLLGELPELGSNYVRIKPLKPHTQESLNSFVRTRKIGEYANKIPGDDFVRTKRLEISDDYLPPYKGGISSPKSKSKCKILLSYLLASLTKLKDYLTKFKN